MKDELSADDTVQNSPILREYSQSNIEKIGSTNDRFY